ncbi:hypothetical protein BpHYR1_052579 [Brachionus plicatilis]|uniref:Uncharacterized protein n=1 Tax=Brachionus plicatilis TaxID=10195 RepID=A0A3M7PF02_BRAPC|nr:hypothetical protein BpHYR1_052579 [Brachionus plicatilis]
MPKLYKSFKKGNKRGYRKKWRLVESLNYIGMHRIAPKLKCSQIYLKTQSQVRVDAINKQGNLPFSFLMPDKQIYGTICQANFLKNKQLKEKHLCFSVLGTAVFTTGSLPTTHFFL